MPLRSPRGRAAKDSHVAQQESWVWGQSLSATRFNPSALPFPGKRAASVDSASLSDSQKTKKHSWLPTNGASFIGDRGCRRSFAPTAPAIPTITSLSCPSKTRDHSAYFLYGIKCHTDQMLYRSNDIKHACFSHHKILHKCQVPILP